MQNEKKNMLSESKYHPCKEFIISCVNVFKPLLQDLSFIPESVTKNTYMVKKLT